MPVGVYKNHPIEFKLRLSESQRERLHKAAHHINKNMSDFIRDAVMIHIANVEENAHQVEERSHKAFVPSTGNGKNAFQRGMEGMRRTNLPLVAEEVAEIQQAPTVVVHTGGSSNGDIVDRLANYILTASNSVEREVRSDSIVKMLRDLEGGDEIARSLDEKIAARTPKKSLWAHITGR